MEELQGFKRYKIGQAAREIGVKTYVLRFWEGEFEEIEPIRTESGQRLYTEEHLEIIREIKRLLYDEKLTIDGAKRKLRTREQSGILREIHDELVFIKKLLKR
ncbi:MAG: MerR family transcriptional regulator [Pseudodesulfovibrio sp.]|uniref:Regulatory protein MerR n=1 Tax=Pseudodesulfovibrio aespoeensis (strain ATCC 700646 / DSM 10631 / Aspo-2) TaxID=643562 RepID=E6VRI9_PSEA9|nr:MULTISPECIES: MerR family transcriptional regulator [Pseudodesulfovibrio]MBU4191248.1 MerR family transcriptional regulator [Pseudomonadota bacterium]ADU63026.1 regulatory protein MerR [Pseudodesulfovibrio aespoeensis Aspo-2]MBU4244149.1 MerR family transcriptional regulator [Pseudomonadota bacterium]MBU4377931.1 MerR family transcriptional regulator [Pseudomonadota bacterium]MBU4475869.1 MerR family transcriptional regulator [Pseudomonadota bacterium]